MRQGQAELLAPAGSFESMKAAVAAGADAVYIGGSRFGARAYADNLDQDRMLEAIDYAHIHGVSLYMTVNTLMKERELWELTGYLRPFYEQGVDGVIVQDLGAMALIRETFPDLPVHASTQMTVTGSYGARILADMGVKRVVTARELSLAEIRRIHREVPVEIECFVHGALCYCYSGQCLLSSFIGGRSGNRGRCAQPCRLPYQVMGKNEIGEESGERREETGARRKDGRGNDGRRDGRGKERNRVAASVKDDRYILSMKDLCTLDIIPDLLEAGVSSLKIEGRMKSPRYTAGTVRMYRKYVDLYMEKGRAGYFVDPNDRQELLELFDRGGFTEGYYRQHNGPDMIARTEKPAFRQGNQKLFEELDKRYVEAEKRESVQGVLTVREGERTSLSLEMADTGKNGAKAGPVTVLGEPAVTARSQPVSKEQLARQIKKTGNTPFELTKLDICLEGKAFVPVQQLNALRRDGLEELRRVLTGMYRRKSTGTAVPPGEDGDIGQEISGGKGPGGEKHAEREPGGEESAGRERAGRKPDRKESSERAERTVPGLHVLLASREALRRVLEFPQVSRILVEADGIAPDQWKKTADACHRAGRSCVLAMPVIFRPQAERYFDRNLTFLKEAGFDRVLIRSLEEAGYLDSRGIKIPLCGDYNLYGFNSAADRLLRKLGCEETAFPLELNGRELMEMGGQARELVGYGYVPVMVSAQCVTKTVRGCTGRPGRMMMRDRTGKELPVENHCAYCYNIIYNPLPLSLAGQGQRILELAPEAVRLQFWWESLEEIGRITDAWVKELYGGGMEKDMYPGGEFTRGHFKRGVE